jgi:prepilin-type N-terminal cleavage/methylation domain-containing protein
MSAQTRSAERRGFSLIEVLISVMLLSLVSLGLASAATLGLSQIAKSKQDLEYSADVQQVGDSLVALGWNKVTSNSATIRGRSVSWTVSTLSPTSQQVSIIVQRRGHATTSVVYPDTVVLYLAK